MNLKTRISEVSRIYKMYGRRLEKLGIKRIEDFFYHVPFRYENYSLISKIGSAQPGEVVTVQGKVIKITNNYTRRFRQIQKAKVEDETGTIDVIWFNQPYIAKTISEGDRISLSGKIKGFKGKPVIESPEFEILNGPTIHTGRLVPIYPETRGVSSKWLRRQVRQILDKNKEELIEYLPYSIIKDLGLTALTNAIEQIHFPDSLEQAEKARKRLSFDELFLLHLISLIRKKEWENHFNQEPFSVSAFKPNIHSFLQKLPFELTNAQKRVLKEVFADLASNKPMNRLLQGEVGSGKTVVATIAMYLTNLNGFQSALMAPTEILANQHHKVISDLLTPFGVSVDLVTSSHKMKIDDKVDVLVGTHAILSSKINFDKLKFVVIDEQQRFGVEQRAQIRKKGESPNFLTMTATPIPRTVALTMYGNLSLSYLDEMPVGRKIVKTWLVPPIKRNAAYRWIEDQIKKSQSQAFIICPFIEESESMTTVRAAKKEYERLKKQVFPNLKLGLLHGKLKSKEKNEVLNKFKTGELDILVATPVVEVGIDIPNATIMLIEGADRFGLAQLHQLRGRVGRSDRQSYCLLFTESQSESVSKRLKSMETIHNGAELAELDLKLRGPGQIHGTMQHGIPQLKIASFSDFDLIKKTREVAEKILPEINKYPKLLEKVKELNISQVSPD